MSNDITTLSELLDSPSLPDAGALFADADQALADAITRWARALGHIDITASDVTRARQAVADAEAEAAEAGLYVADGQGGTRVAKNAEERAAAMAIARRAPKLARLIAQLQAAEWTLAQHKRTAAIAEAEISRHKRRMEFATSINHRLAGMGR